MHTNTFITYFLIVSLIFSTVDSRIAVERKSIPTRFEKNSERSKRGFDPQASPLNTIKSASQWRPKNQQPEGQVYLK